MFDTSKLSSRYRVRRMKDSDADDILALCLQNTQYYQFCGKQPSKELILNDLHMTPPNTPADAKFYVGFYDGDTLAAVMDLIEGYPNAESAELFADAVRQGDPERGAFVFYDCLCPGEDGPVNWGHCGIALGDGSVIHAWDEVRIDNYLDIERLTAITGDHPRYIGWVPLEQVLRQKPDDGTVGL